MKKRLLTVAIILFSLVVPFGATGFADYSRIVAFGDSLSDNGPGDGHGFGVSSDGPVWLDYLAGNLGVDLLDMAYGGARTYGANDYYTNPDDPPFGLKYGFGWQIEQYITNAGTADKDALYTLWIGGNDLLAIENQTDAGSVVNTAVTNISEGIKDLVNAGAENILVMNMPNLGATPLMNGSDATAAGGFALSAYFNTQLDAAIAPYGSAINLFEVDVFAWMNQFINEGVFDNSTEMLTDAGVTNDSYLFWDGIHPTTLAHGYIAEEVARTVAPVPVPAAVWLLGSGMLGLAGVRARFKK